MAATPSGTARVTIHRTHGDDVRQRQVIVRLDDRPPVTLTFGETFTAEVDPGSHRLRLHNTLVRKKIEIELKPGEHAEFDAINRTGKMTLGFLSLLGVAPLFLTVTRRG